MKKRKLNLFFGTKTLLSIVLLVSTVVFNGCYEKENIDVVEEIEPQPAAYYIAGVVTDYNSGGALQGASVNIEGYPTVSTGQFGQFCVKLDDQVPNPAGYTVKISYNGYDEVTRQIYISTVGQGLTCITTANTSLRVTGTITSTPSVEADKSVSAEETVAAATMLADKIDEVVLNQEAKEVLIEELTTAIPEEVKGDIGLITVGTPDVQAGAGGVVNVSTVVSFTGAVSSLKATQMTYAYNLISGFEVTDDIQEVAAPVKSAKSAGDKISDATLIALFETAVAAELNMSKGFATTTTSVDYSIPAGKKVVGYEIKDGIVIERHTFLINGKYISGLVAVHKGTSVVPRYVNLPADTHDAHDGTGHDPNAGGGSGE
ncbi:MAG: carboxypeptidase-like regulatory domain-containing protein [Prevotella sp.]|jgi:hypothetical protein|nr:carboxypeptidase-like regulatory domain-containing protein [Prevotella sp.]